MLLSRFKALFICYNERLNPHISLTFFSLFIFLFKFSNILCKYHVFCSFQFFFIFCCKIDELLYNGGFHSCPVTLQLGKTSIPIVFVITQSRLFGALFVFVMDQCLPLSTYVYLSFGFSFEN